MNQEIIERIIRAVKLKEWGHFHEQEYALAREGRTGWSIREDGAFKFVPYQTDDDFFAELKLASRLAGGKKFIDIGCGYGTKLLVAHRAGLDPYGIEYDESYVKEGRQLLVAYGLDPSRLIHANGLTFPNYADFNVLYWYRPIHTERLMDELSSAICEGMSLRAIACMKGWWARPEQFTRIGRDGDWKVNLYRKYYLAT